MINYEPTKSSLFDTNKKFCEEIESKLKSMNIDCSGFCNCYGYNIDALLTNNNGTFNIKYHKHQTTQNGIVVPFEAIDYAGVELTATGIDKRFCLSVGKSSFRRIFCSTEIKSKIPKPYFIKSNKLTDDNTIFNLLERLEGNHVSTIKLRNGKLICKIHVPTADPQKLIADIGNAIKNWI